MASHLFCVCVAELDVRDGGRLECRWADDTHALIVFSEIQEAAYALEHAPEIGRLWLKPYEQVRPPAGNLRAT